MLASRRTQGPERHRPQPLAGPKEREIGSQSARHLDHRTNIIQHVVLPPLRRPEPARARTARVRADAHERPPRGVQHPRDLVQHVHPTATAARGHHLQRAQRPQRRGRGWEAQVGDEPQRGQDAALSLSLSLRRYLRLCMCLCLVCLCLCLVRGSRVGAARAPFTGTGLTLPVAVTVTVPPPAGVVRRAAFCTSVESVLLIVDLRGRHGERGRGRLGGAGLRGCVRVRVRVRVRMRVLVRVLVRMRVHVRLGNLQGCRSEDLARRRRRGRRRRRRRVLRGRIFAARPRALDVGDVARALIREGKRPRASAVVFVA